MKSVLVITLFYLILFRASVLDVKSKQIQNYYSGLIIIVSLFYISDIPLLQRFVEGVIISIPLIIIWIIWKKGLGAGDIKLIFGCTLVLGIEKVMWGLLLGMVLAGVAGIALRKINNKNKIPLVPFISLGMFITVFIK